MIQQDALETREFTTNLMVRSKAAMVVGVEGISNNSGDHCRRGTTQFTASRATPFDCLHQNDIDRYIKEVGFNELRAILLLFIVTNRCATRLVHEQCSRIPCGESLFKIYSSSLRINSWLGLPSEILNIIFTNVVSI
jgi:hypothetical protein